MPHYRRYQPAPNYSSLPQERGEHYLNYVRRSTSPRRLIEPTRLVYDLALLSDGTSQRDICDAILDQYSLTRDQFDVRWIEKIRNEARTILCTERWVEDNLLSLIRSSNLRRRARSTATAASSSPSGMCVDIRLRNNPKLDVVRENAVEDPLSYTEESVMEIANTDCPVSIDHEVAGSPVTRVPMEPAAFVKEVLTVEDECVGSRESSHAVVSQKRRLPLRHVQQNDYSETADKRARLSPEIQVAVVRPRVNFQWCPFPGCNVKNRKIKRHVQQSHLPRIFSDVKPIRSMEEFQLCKLQFAALESLVRIVVGHDASVFTAVDYVNQTHQIPQETTLHPDTVACIRRLCDHQH